MAGRSISAWLASQRRSVARAFALLMEVELKQFGLPQPVRNVDQALQQVAELVGTGYRLPVGWSRGRGGRMPILRTRPRRFGIVLQWAF